MTAPITPETVTVDLTREQAIVLVEAALFTVTRSESANLHPDLADQLVASATILQESLNPPVHARHLSLVKP